MSKVATHAAIKGVMAVCACHCNVIVGSSEGVFNRGAATDGAHLLQYDRLTHLKGSFSYLSVPVDQTFSRRSCLSHPFFLHFAQQTNASFSVKNHYIHLKKTRAKSQPYRKMAFFLNVFSNSEKKKKNLYKGSGSSEAVPNNNTSIWEKY